MVTFLAAVLSLLLVPHVNSLQAQLVAGIDDAGGKAHVSAVWQNKQVNVGGQAVLAVVFNVQPNWHIASDAAQVVPGDFTPYATAVTVKSSDPRLTFGEPLYPKAHELPVGGMPDPIAVFDGQAVVYLPVTIGADAEPGEVDVVIQAEYQACDDVTCDFPQTVTASARLTLVGADTALQAPIDPAPLFADFDPNVFDAMAGEADWGIPEAQWPSPDGGKMQATAVWQKTELRPDGLGVLAVVLDVMPGWHAASDEAQAVKSGFDPYFTTVTVEDADARITFGEPQFPKAHVLPVGGMPDPTAVFDGRAVVYLPVAVSGDADAGPAQATITINYQACDDKTCDFPSSITVPVSLNVIAADAEETAVPGPLDLFKDFDSAGFKAIGGEAPVTLPSKEESASSEVDFLIFKVNPSGPVGFTLLLLLAAIGGALLNFTPCVLPVIPIKILGLAQTAGNRRRTLALGLVMGAGVAAFWSGLGLAIATVSDFTASNQLFQYPAFTISVGVIIAILAVGMCGLFAIRLPNFVYAINPGHDSYTGSFGFGVMTAVLSTPCTAPMMGAAAVWATKQPPEITLVTFVAIGVGMALPYVILSANPKLVDSLPRTGPGSELLKQVMGLLMLAAAAFFIGAGIAGMLSDGTEAAPKGHWWAVGAIVAAAGVWLIIRIFKATQSPVKRGVFTAFGLLMIVLAGLGSSALSHPSDAEDAPINWVYYTPERLEQALADGNVVLLDFTADWCANCHTLELYVLNSEEVSTMLKGEGYVAMKVDLTGNYADGKQKLKDTGSVTIPWLVVYAPDGREVFTANFYTSGQITDALTRAKQPPS